MVEANDPRIISRTHLDYYGIETNDKFVADLAAYVRDPSRTPAMLQSGDAQQVIDTIKDIYGVRVTREYANDLLAFSERSGDKDK